MDEVIRTSSACSLSRTSITRILISAILSRAHESDSGLTPTTGSVTTTSAEKQRLAKSSLAFNCRKKMFPEYEEKYEQQQLSNQPVSEQVFQVPTQQENSTPLLDKKGESKEEDQNKVEAPRDLKNRAKKSIPTWMLLLLVSIFGAVTVLPLLQLRH